VTIRPRGDRILIRRDEAEGITKGGIVLPESMAKDRPQRGTVLAVGPGRRLLTVMGTMYSDPIRATVGQEVIFTKYAGEGIKVGDEEFFLVKEEDLIADIEPEDESDADIYSGHPSLAMADA
jgi:chaperonin GroES